MRHLLGVLLLGVTAVSASCGGSSTTLAPSSINALTDASTGNGTVSFGGLTANGASVVTYAESGFAVSAISGAWSARTDYGHPAPFIQFWAEKGTTVNGEIRVAAAGSSPFYFKSIDLYSSTTPIPYAIRGMRNGSTVFASTDTLPNTFGDFRTVVSANSADAIDTLSIALTNAAAACCRNPVGLDTIVLTSTPTTPSAPTMFSLSGQVTDSATGAGISGAIVSIADGPNAHLGATTDASGNYRFTGLQGSAFTVNVSANHYVSESKGVTLTSNQTLAFRLVHVPPPPAGTTVISFDGLTVNSAPVATYAESGFTVVQTSGAWVAVTTYGHPAPSLQFFADAGTTVSGAIRVTGAGATFAFKSVDLYSSTTKIPYTIAGSKHSVTVFTLANTLPNTFGNFVTISNPNADAVIDTLSIVLTNAAVACCRNPMGVDTIVLTQ